MELDCVHEVPGAGAWLKVPLGKLDSERMVPLDDDTVLLIDRIAETRSPGRPLPHPKTRRMAEFLLTHHGKRISAAALRDELARAAKAAGLPKATPHQLRHTWATASTMGRIASGASICTSREHALPAAQPAAPRCPRPPGPPRGCGDLGLHGPPGSDAAMMQLIPLRGPHHHCACWHRDAAGRR